MNLDQPERLDRKSMSISGDRIAKLREDFPEVFREGKVDFDALKRSLGEWVDPGKERFGLQWPGKAECIKVIQQASVGTLLPQREESVDFDTTQNLIIEGDNLEVLKLLQKSYYGKVKMIYIDPPYNTGNEFIYPDNFKEGLQEYLKYSGQVNAEGVKTSTNTESDGRYHSKWLNMMYPRLFLARNFLKDEGVIFISIDDHEMHNLRAICNEIFGEENLIAVFVWQKKYSRDNRPVVGTVHEYILAFAKNSSAFAEIRNLLPPSEDSIKVYRNPNNDPRGRWRPVPLTAQAGHATASQFYEITSPSGVVHKPSEGRCWSVSKATFEKLHRDGRIWFGNDGCSQPNLIRYLSEIEGFVPWTWLPSTEVGHTDEAKKEINSLLGKEENFDTPKPIRLLRHLAQLILKPNDHDISLDFFAGTGTLAHSVMKLNSEDGGNRRYILVQLPEPIEGDLKNIANLTRERVSRASKIIAESQLGKLEFNRSSKIDFGFRSYNLTTSNFKPWESNSPTTTPISEQLNVFTENLLGERDDEDIFTEILIKSGFELTASIERLSLASKTVFSVAQGALLICLDRELTLETIEAMVDRKPAQIVVLDAGFKSNDPLKVNAVQTIKARARREESTIAFKVV